MSDLIRLLPESVANQIAAGEVIQRPASAVKEMMENAIDSGALNIQLIVHDAGKSLIQVVDDGCGMTFSDARMCFERHATSKIKLAEDIFKIKTMGFRGEALASIAAIANVELKSRRHDAETGVQLIIGGSVVEAHTPIACQAGTSISVKNLFFNTPARRNFLKSNASETRHILEEFNRVALAHPGIAFSLVQDGNEVYHLPVGNTRQRIASLMGNNYNERLVPVSEESSIISVDGFIGKPEFARKTRGEQYFFVNKRFIKDAYLNHAVFNAFEDLLPQKSYPAYYIYITTDPSHIDVNIHPTKTEIKFDDDKSVYSILRAVVKRALGKFSVTPSLDFDQENAFSIPVSMYQQTPQQPTIKVNPRYNPFEHTGEGSSHASQPSRTSQPSTSKIPDELLFNKESDFKTNYLKVAGQLGLKYILCYNNNEAVIIDQQAAHERIVYEDLRTRFESGPVSSQQELFPVVMEFSHQDYVIVNEITEDLIKIGFDISEFGKNTIVISSLPEGIQKGDEKKIIEQLIEEYRNNQPKQDNDPREVLLKRLTATISIRSGQRLEVSEMQLIADKLLYCKQPNFSPTGRSTFITLAPEQVSGLLKQNSTR